MKTNFLKKMLVGAVLVLGVLRARAADNMVLIANPGVSGESISAGALKDIYTGRETYWPDGQSVVIAVLAGNRDETLSEVSGMDGSQFKTFWRRLVFSGRGHQPMSAPDAAALVALVASTKGAVGLVPADVVLKGVKTMKVTGASGLLADPPKGQGVRRLFENRASDFAWFRVSSGHD